MTMKAVWWNPVSEEGVDWDRDDTHIMRALNHSVSDFTQISEKHKQRRFSLSSSSQGNSALSSLTIVCLYIRHILHTGCYNICSAWVYKRFGFHVRNMFLNMFSYLKCFIFFVLSSCYLCTGSESQHQFRHIFTVCLNTLVQFSQVTYVIKTLSITTDHQKYTLFKHFSMFSNVWVENTKPPRVLSQVFHLQYKCFCFS